MTIEEIVTYATTNVVNGAVLKGMLEALVAEEEEEEEDKEEEPVTAA